MKKTFLVEIEIAEPWIQDGFEFSEAQIEESFQRGIGELLPYAYESETKVKVMEQNRGTLDFSREKALSLLKQAAQRLHEYCLHTGGPYHEPLGREIEEYIRENSIGRNT